MWEHRSKIVAFDTHDGENKATGINTKRGEGVGREKKVKQINKMREMKHTSDKKINWGNKNNAKIIMLHGMLIKKTWL